MVNKRSSNNSETSHRCGRTCLGPLTFHCQAVGDKVRLSEGGRLAERAAHTFKNGLVFSSRPLRVNERIRLKVEKDTFSWHGALRVGFTTVPPAARSLPCMAIPNLTDTPGHWAAPVHDSYCSVGSELQFWVTSGGSVYVANKSGMQHKILEGVDLSRPLWAMIDIYGQTCSVFLLGSEKGDLFTRRSCPAPKRLTSPDVDIGTGFISDVLSPIGNSKEHASSLETADDVCVVCMVKKATFTLCCGHRCLCDLCIPRVVQQFGTCPLCRMEIR
ncbi:E3 ubiquitin-protein ligase NEURL3 [Anabas testudineus]|uniref:Uncharacterized protein n=1 Tax=Anabas testudineus TaxID=64144 RepID=A0A3Q1JS21_ANATE|nr:E3 ubiquitin-protein ligase NEURL3 [Anabas testudineus]